MYTYTYAYAYTRTYIRAGRQADRQKDRQTDTQIYIYIYTYLYRYRDAYVNGKPQKEADACLKLECARSFFLQACLDVGGASWWFLILPFGSPPQHVAPYQGVTSPHQSFWAACEALLWGCLGGALQLPWFTMIVISPWQPSFDAHADRGSLCLHHHCFHLPFFEWRSLKVKGRGFGTTSGFTSPHRPREKLAEVQKWHMKSQKSAQWLHCHI